MRLFPMAILTSIAMAATAIPVTAAQIHTGGESGSYYNTFCPNLVRQLDKLNQPSQCLTSTGTGENIQRIERNPDELGYGQLDIFALESKKRDGREKFEIIRSDDARECVFAVTRNKQITNYGELAVNADRLRFILPPKDSGSAKTFEFLQSIDMEDGLSKANNVINANDTDEAIRLALSDENAVTFFVQFPDPSNERFRTIRKLGGHIVPIIDGIILDQQFKGEPVYYAQETSISQLKWLNLGKTVVTVCTPMVLFTGAQDQLASRDQRVAHRQLVLSIRALRTEELVPLQSPIAKMIKTTRQLSTRARYHFQEMSMNARERARPIMERIYRGAGHWIRVMILKARPPEYREIDISRNQ